MYFKQVLHFYKNLQYARESSYLYISLFKSSKFSLKSDRILSFGYNALLEPNKFNLKKSMYVPIYLNQLNLISRYTIV